MFVYHERTLVLAWSLELDLLSSDCPYLNHHFHMLLSRKCAPRGVGNLIGYSVGGVAHQMSFQPLLSLSEIRVISLSRDLMQENGIHVKSTATDNRKQS